MKALYLLLFLFISMIHYEYYVTSATVKKQEVKERKETYRIKD